ncbi:hypothetical protein QJQ45_012182, partial [Haematococcus lacustris]
APEVLRCPTKNTPDQFKSTPGAAHYEMGADAWAVGVFAFELVAGGSPFKAEQMVDTARNIISVNINYPAAMSERARSFISGCLKKHPGKASGAAGQGIRGSRARHQGQQGKALGAAGQDSRASRVKQQGQQGKASGAATSWHLHNPGLPELLGLTALNLPLPSAARVLPATLRLAGLMPVSQRRASVVIPNPALAHLSRSDVSAGSTESGVPSGPHPEQPSPAAR